MKNNKPRDKNAPAGYRCCRSSAWLTAFVSPWPYIWSATVEFRPSIPLRYGDIIHTAVLLWSQWGTCTTRKKKKNAVSYAPSLFESVVHWSLPPWILSAPPSSPAVSLMTGMQLEKYLATMTRKSAHLTSNMSLTLHFLHSSLTVARHNALLNKLFCLYQCGFFSHLSMICFIAGIVGIVVTRWPVKPLRWYDRYWSQLSMKDPKLCVQII